MSNNSKQDDLIKFLSDPETIKRAAEGSMEKRQKLLDSKQPDELDEILKSINNGYDYIISDYCTSEAEEVETEKEKQAELLAAKAALLQREQRLVAEARIDELGRAYPEMMKHRGLYGEGNYYYDDRIAQLRHNTNTGKGKLE